jgi:hypothetical protein
MTRLDELRAKTDSDIIQLIHNELDLGVCAAHEAIESVDDSALADAYRQRAKSACKEAARLMFLLGEIETVGRCEVDAKLERLREMLEALSHVGSTPTPSEHTIATLARALWEVRGCPEGLPEEDWYRAERALKPKERKESSGACVGI